LVNHLTLLSTLSTDFLELTYQLYPPGYSKPSGTAVAATVENMQGARLPLRVARKSLTRKSVE
jgi:hypothetical protein